jgi:hypothetical protein
MADDISKQANAILQLSAILSSIATLLRQYYEAMKGAGFSEPDAWALTRELQKLIFDKVLAGK